MHYYVGKFDASGFYGASTLRRHFDGFERVSLINREVGSVHAEACISRLAPADISRRACTPSKRHYVVEGEIEVAARG